MTGEEGQSPNKLIGEPVHFEVYWLIRIVGSCRDRCSEATRGRLKSFASESRWSVGAGK